MKQNEIPLFYQEHLEIPLRFGKAVQHENTTESALAIVTWLAEQGITAWASTLRRSLESSFVRIDYTEILTVFPNDWVFVTEDRLIYVFDHFDFETKFHDASKVWQFPGTNKENN